MYDLTHFKATNQEEVIAFMKAHPFVVLCGIDASGKPVATHVPVLLVEKENKLFLQAHIMRKQLHTIAFETNQHVLAIFHGAHTYVSAQMYEPQNVASTWNYSAVHASGEIRFMDDAGLLALLTSLTAHFENNPHSPASMDKLDENYVSNHMKAIVGFEIEVTDLQHVFKWSQNKDEATKANITKGLEKGNTNDQLTAIDMKAHFNLHKTS
jgi:transcriptional regulator